MDREQELKKLINVLNRMSRTAVRVQWTGAGESEARFAVTQFNRILARLFELDEHVKGLFAPLAEDSTLTVVAMAARQVVSYYEDEVHTERGGRFEGARRFSPGWRGSRWTSRSSVTRSGTACMNGNAGSARGEPSAAPAADGWEVRPLAQYGVRRLVAAFDLVTAVIDDLTARFFFIMQ